jgi:hypothetical protein
VQLCSDDLKRIQCVCCELVYHFQNLQNYASRDEEKGLLNAKKSGELEQLASSMDEELARMAEKQEELKKVHARTSQG